MHRVAAVSMLAVALIFSTFSRMRADQPEAMPSVKTASDARAHASKLRDDATAAAASVEQLAKDLESAQQRAREADVNATAAERSASSAEDSAARDLDEQAQRIEANRAILTHVKRSVAVKPSSVASSERFSKSPKPTKMDSPFDEESPKTTATFNIRTSKDADIFFGEDQVGKGDHTERRTYVSAILNPGQSYHYLIRAVDPAPNYRERERTYSFKAGDVVDVDLP